MSKRGRSEVSVLFVCMGNICRSPIAEGTFRKYLAVHSQDFSVAVDSAGTHSYHVGEAPDERAQFAASRRGIDISNLKARQVEQADFERFNYVLAMDRDNLAILRQRAAQKYHEKVRLFLEFSAAYPSADVPDPYYGDAHGFERVLDLVEEGSAGLLRELRIASNRKG